MKFLIKSVFIDLVTYTLSLKQSIVENVMINSKLKEITQPLLSLPTNTNVYYAYHHKGYEINSVFALAYEQMKGARTHLSTQLLPNQK